MLLESLTKWSIGQRTESQVSDVYVRLGNDFGVAKVAFGSYGIDMSDLASVPDDLRDCLEQCLSEDASPAVLDVHLPRIRQIVVSLLQGLKAKQAEYKAVLHQSRSSSKASREQSMGHVKRTSKLSQSESAPVRTETEDGDPQRSKSSGQSSRGSVGLQRRLDQETAKRPTAAPPIDEIVNSAARGGVSSVFAQRSDSSSSLPNRDAEATSSTSSHPAGPRKRKSQKDRGTEEAHSKTPSTSAIESGDRPQEANKSADGLVRHSLVDAPAPSEPSSTTAPPPPSSYRPSGSMSRPSRKSPRSGSRELPSSSADVSTEEVADAADPSLRALKQRDALERRASKRFSAYTFNKMGVGLNQGFGMSSFNLGSNGAQSPMPESRRDSPSHSRVGSRRLQMRAGNETPDDLTTKKGSVDYFGRTPTAQRHKGGALSASDAIQEVTSPDVGPSDDGQLRSKSHSLDDKAKKDPSPEQSSVTSPTEGRLAPPTVQQQAMSSTESLPFVDAQGTSPDHEPQDMPPIPTSSLHNFNGPQPAMPPLPTPAERAKLDAAQNLGSASRWLATPASQKGITDAADGSTPKLSSFPQASTSSNTLGVFLQLGRQTRRATLELDPLAPLGGLTIGKLRMLFMDRFTYSPGKDDFPAIYIKDVTSGVSYELEDLADVGEGCVLTLNIERECIFFS